MDPTIVHLAVATVAGVAIVQLVIAFLSRALRVRLHRHVQRVAVVLALVLVSGFVVGGRIMFPTAVLEKANPDLPGPTIGAHYTTLNDLVYQFMPWEAEVRRALAAGRLPLWSDRIDGGSTLWSNPQAEPASPIAMLARLAPLEHHLLVALALKLLVGFQGAWLLARMLGARRWLSMAAAAGFSLGGGLMAWSFFPHSTTAAWIPWLVAAAIRTSRRPSARLVATTAIITAATLLSGHPETALGGGVLTAWCVLTMGRRSNGLSGLIRGASAASVAAILGFAVAAPQLLPFVDLLPHTVRYDRMTGGEPSAHWETGRWLDPEGVHLLKGVVSPRAFDGLPYTGKTYLPVAGTGYAGLVALAGALTAAAMGIRRCWPFLGFAAATVLMVAGMAPMIDVVSRLPILGAMSWSRLFPTLSLCIAVCGAVGISAMARRRSTAGLVASAVAAGISLAVCHSLVMFALWAAVLAGLSLVMIRPRIGSLVLAGVLVVDLAPWAIQSLPKGDPRLFYPETPLIRALVEEVENRGSCRAVALGFTHYPSWLSIHGVTDVRYHNPVAYAPYARLLAAAFEFHPEDQPYEYQSSFGRPERLLLDFLNVGFVISGREKMPRRFEPVEGVSAGWLRLYRNRRILPRAFIAIDTVSVAGSDTVEATVTNPDPRIVTLNRDEVGSWQPDPHRWSRKFVITNSKQPGDVSLTVKGKGERLLATSFTHPFGWRATADGQRLRTVTINHAFLGVIVPADVHEVDLRFTPPGFTAGVALFAVGALIIVGLLLWPVVRRS